jgi:hypothetical protein
MADLYYPLSDPTSEIARLRAEGARADERADNLVRAEQARVERGPGPRGGLNGGYMAPPPAAPRSREQAVADHNTFLASLIDAQARGGRR